MNFAKPSNTKEIIQKAVKGTKWVFFSTVGSGVFQLVVTIITARLLAPADFGLFAYAMIFISVMALFQDLGMRQALIQRKDRVEDAADIVFISNIVLGVFWYIGTFIIAPYVADFFGNPQVTKILRVMALSFLILPFGFVQNTLLTKDLYFKKLFYLSLAPAVVPGIASILLAFYGYGVWSLVYGSLIGAFLNVLVMWWMVVWRPRWRFDKMLAGQMLKFGRAVSAESVLSWVVNTMDDVLVGKWLGSAALGFYTIGFNISIAPAKYISSSLIKIAFPAFSKLQENKDEIREAFLKVIKYISLITFPLGVGIATTASLFIPVLFGEKWRPSVPVIQIISLYGIFMSIGSIIPQVYKALGRPDIYLKYVSARSAVAIPVYYYAVPFGLTAISMAHLVLTILFFPVNFYIGMRVMGIPFNKVFDHLWVSAVGSFGVAFSATILQKVFQYSVQLSSVWTLSLTVGISILFYFAIVYFANKDTFRGMRDLFKKAIAK